MSLATREATIILDLTHPKIMNLYLHAKNQATSSIFSGDIVDFKILQSEWLAGKNPEERAVSGSRTLPFVIFDKKYRFFQR